MLLCKLQNAHNYSVGMLLGSYSGKQAQFVRSAGQESSVEAVTCRASEGYVPGPLLFITYIDNG
jgi:hypothetical protein